MPTKNLGLTDPGDRRRGTSGIRPEAEHSPQEVNVLNRGASPCSPTASPVDGARPSPEAIRTQVAQILANSSIGGRPRLAKFLSFIVEESLAGRGQSLKQFTVALNVFARDASFEPRTDPVVRIQAGRLRRALRAYYETEGISDPILIGVPSGAYAPTFAWQRHTGGEPRRSVRTQMAPPIVAVLPFVNLTGDSGYDYFADGIGEELSIALSAFDIVRVVAYWSTLPFEIHSEPAPEIGRKLGADFVVIGNLRSTPDALRVNVRLCRVSNREQLWAEGIDLSRQGEGLLEVQRGLIQRVASRIGDEYGVIPNLVAEDVRGALITDLGLYEAVLRAHHANRALTPEAISDARLALDRAVTLQPESAKAWALLAQSYFDGFVFGYSDNQGDLEKGRECAYRSVTLDSSCQFAHYAAAYAHLVERNRGGIISSAERIAQLNPNAAFMLGAAGWWIAIGGEYARGVAMIENSIALNPHYPTWFHFARYLERMQARDYNGALEEAARFGMPDFFWSPLMRAATFGLLRRLPDAKAAYARICELQPGFPIRAREHVQFFVLDENLSEILLDGLRVAGWDEGCSATHGEQTACKSSTNGPEREQFDSPGGG